MVLVSLHSGYGKWQRAQHGAAFRCVFSVARNHGRCRGKEVWHDGRHSHRAARQEGGVLSFG